MSLPSWIENVAKESQTNNMMNYVPRLIQALGIAWEALESYAKDIQVKPNGPFVPNASKEAMRRITELGEDK